MASISREVSVVLNAISNYVRFAVALACTFLLTPVLVNGLGATNYGLWTFVLCIASYLELFDCGLTTASMRFTAWESRTDPQARNRLVNTLLCASFAMIPVLCLATYAIAVWNGQSIVEQGMPSAALLIVLVGIRVLLSLPANILMGALCGEHRLWIVNLTRTFSVALYSASAYFVLARGYGVTALGVVYMLVYTLESLGMLLAARLALPWYRFRPAQFDPALCKRIAGFGMSSVLSNLSNVVMMRTDPLIISTALPLTAVALYAVPMRITEQLFLLNKQLVNVFSPVFAELHGQRRSEMIRATYFACTKFSLAMMLGIVIPAIYFSEDGLRYWIGAEYADAHFILWMLLAAAVLRVIQESSANLLAMTGGHKTAASIALGVAITNVLLSWLVVSDWGIEGVAVATLLSVTVVGFVASTLSACRSLNIRIGTFLRAIVLPVLLPAFIQIAVLILASMILTPSNLLRLIVVSVMSGCAFVSACILFALNSHEKRILRAWASKLQSRLPGGRRQAAQSLA